MNSSSATEKPQRGHVWRLTLRELAILVVICAAALGLGLEVHAQLKRNVEPQLSRFVDGFDFEAEIQQSLRANDLQARLNKNESTEGFGYSYAGRAEQDRAFLALYEDLDGPFDPEVLATLRAAMFAELESRDATVSSALPFPESLEKLQFSFTYQTPSMRGFVFVKVLDLGEQRFAFEAALYEHPIKPWSED